MRLFIDTANIDEVRTAQEWGVISGVTTNPSLVAREGREFHELVREIAQIVDGPISAEVLALEAEGMVEEAAALSALSPNVVIKLPMTAEGLKACKALTSRGIRTNLTLVFSPNQALLAALAGATYVSPFVGRLDDISHDGIHLVREIVQIYRTHEIPTQVIAASIRHPLHVVEAAKAGAQIATVPFKVIEAMTAHPLTQAGIDRFLADWNKVR